MTEQELFKVATEEFGSLILDEMKRWSLYHDTKIKGFDTIHNEEYGVHVLVIGEIKIGKLGSMLREYIEGFIEGIWDDMDPEPSYRFINNELFIYIPYYP